MQRNILAILLIAIVISAVFTTCADVYAQSMPVRSMVINRMQVTDSPQSITRRTELSGISLANQAPIPDIQIVVDGKTLMIRDLTKVLVTPLQSFAKMQGNIIYESATLPLTVDFRFTDRSAQYRTSGLLVLPSTRLIVPNWVSPSVYGYRISIDKGFGYVSCFRANVYKICFRLTRDGQSKPLIDIHIGKGQKQGKTLLGICNTGTAWRWFPERVISYCYDNIQSVVYEVSRDIGLGAVAAWVVVRTIGPQIWNFLQQLPAYGIP